VGRSGWGEGSKAATRPVHSHPAQVPNGKRPGPTEAMLAREAEAVSQAVRSCPSAPTLALDRFLITSSGTLIAGW
jgi:hypothetical protein